MKICEALRAPQARKLDPTETEAMLLASSRVNGGRAWIRANSDFVLSPIEVAKYFEMCERRLAGEPLAYITGSRGFYGLELAIDARVLDPRPDTETSVLASLAQTLASRFWC
jgi:release factor glutamine methyltransferase